MAREHWIKELNHNLWNIGLIATVILLAFVTSYLFKAGTLIDFFPKFDETDNEDENNEGGDGSEE